MSRLTAAAFAAVLLASGLAAHASRARADDPTDSSDQPYIDQLKKSLPPVQDSEGYTESIKGKLAPDTSAGYTEKLKQAAEAQPQASPSPSSEGYTDQVKQTLEPKQEGGAIEALKEGNAELKMKKSLDITQAVGFRYGVAVGRTFSAAPNIGTGEPFNTVYGQSYAPDAGLFYERQLFHDERVGSVGFFAMGGISYFTGSGQFAVAIQSAIDGSTLTSSQVAFRFFEVPVTAGGTLRLNLTKYVSPYLMAGPTGIGFSENRNDGFQTHYGLSYGGWGAAGVAILMDWVSRTGDWDRYSDYSIKHTYFTIEYDELKTAADPVDFSTSGAYAGILFEF